MPFSYSFEEWLRYQHFGPVDPNGEAYGRLREAYEQARSKAASHDVHNVVRTPPPLGEVRYAVAIEQDEKLWLTLWIRRSPKGEIFVFWPRGRGEWNPHTSYHRDGRFHSKSDGVKAGVQHRQRLDRFAGTEHLGVFAGHGTGASLCYPEGFTSVLRVPPGTLTGTSGSVLIDLIEPGHSPAPQHRDPASHTIVLEETYRDVSPWVVVAVTAPRTNVAPLRGTSE